MFIQPMLISFVKSYLLCLDHVSSFDVMNQNTFVHIRRKLFLALITLDCPSCSRPKSKYFSEFLFRQKQIWCKFWNKRAKLGPTCLSSPLLNPSLLPLAGPSPSPLLPHHQLALSQN